MRTTVRRGSSAPSLEAGRRARRGMGTALVAAVLLCGLAAGLRLWNLSSPPETYWDEHYYALDAYAYLGGVPPLPTRPPSRPSPARTAGASRRWASG